MSSPQPLGAKTSDQPPPYDAATHPAAYSQPQPGVAYPVQPVGAVTTSTVIAQPTVPVMMPLMFGPDPVNLTCPHCQATIVTSTNFTPGALTWLLCGGLAVVGCWLGCCLIPFCITDLHDCKHTCPNCNNVLGAYRRI